MHACMHACMHTYIYIYIHNIPASNDKQFAIEAMAIEIVSFRLNMVIFHIYVNVYRRVDGKSW